MNLRPVIERELRVASRRKTTYANRAAPGLLLGIVCGMALYAYSRSPFPPDGAELFSVLRVVLFCVIWLTVPLAAADCLSREKRDDTLGLLLLTPLRPIEVVISKMFTAFWEGGMMALAALPMLAISFLLGGVTARDWLSAVISTLTALVSAVTVGVVASSLCERRGRAWLLVLVFGIIFLWVQLSVMGWLVLAAWGGQGPVGNLSDILQGMRIFIVPPAIGWLQMSGVAAARKLGVLAANVNLLTFSLSILVLTLVTGWLGLRFAARRVQKYATLRLRSARQQRMDAVFTREKFAVKLLKSRRKRLLDRNPMAWMQERRWSQRLVKWGWLLVCTGFISAATFDRGYGFIDSVLLVSVWLGSFILFSLLLVTSSNLQSERDGGALELLLVTPLSPREFVRGRIAGFWKSFLPAAALLLFTFWYYALLDFQMSWDRDHLFQFLDTTIALTLFFGLLLFGMPAIGLCLSLSQPGFTAAAAGTLFFAVLIPWALPPLLVAAGYAAHELHVQPDNLLTPFWVWPVAWAVMTGGLQFAIWRTIRKGTANLPLRMPRWFRRWKLALILPWILPPLSFGFFELPADWQPDFLMHNDAFAFCLWHVTAWGLLCFFSFMSRRSLIQMLSERSFANGFRST